MDFKDLLTKISEYLPPEKIAGIEEAYKFAAEAGKSELNQTLETTSILADLQLSADCLIASLLHGLPQDNKELQSQIESRFGAEVKKLVEGTSRVRDISSLTSSSQVESLRKMFLAMAEDIRVIFIVLAQRLQIMRNLKTMPPEKRQNLAQETMAIYAPLAHRLGIWQLKWELEDLSFRWLQPDEYREIVHLLDAKRTERERYITYACRILKDEFQKAGLKAEVSGRPKNIYSIYTKMRKYLEQGKEFSDIHDLLALRVLVNEVQDCYNALGIIHSLWHPLLGQFDDYIANPKGNMYQSLHTTVIALEGRPLEIQIRTYEMHRIAEYGVAAHWRYKEGTRGDMRFEERLAWFRQLMEWQKDLSGALFLESIKTDIFRDQVYVFTPKGEIKELPQGSTPIDFAYRVHTELGHRCTGAKVNGKLVPLTYELKNGDVVEILATKSERGPSLDWLNPDLGYVKSRHAEEKIRQWFRRRERRENLERGKELLERELKRLGISASEEEIADLFGYKDLNEFLIAIGCGDLSVHQIGPKLVHKEEAPPPPVTPKQPQPSPGIQVLGVGNLLTHLAPCCTPVPGDEIVGFITRTKGVTIHRKNCPNIAGEDEKERLIPVSWGPRVQSYPASICIKAQDRVGLIKDISTVISEEKININTISNVNHDDGTTSIFLTLDITDVGQLSKLFSRLQRVPGLINVSRTTGNAK